MKIKLMLSVAILAVILGCRREDVRDYTIEIPELTDANKAQVVEALAKYAGIKKDSFKWDMAAKTLTLKYDSMAIAKTNIRMAIEEKGLKVKNTSVKGNENEYNQHKVIASLVYWRGGVLRCASRLPLVYGPAWVFSLRQSERALCGDFRRACNCCKHRLRT